MTDAELAEIEARVSAVSPAPWVSWVEGRDHWGGDSFVMMSEGDSRAGLYISRDDGGGKGLDAAHDLDFIAHARQDLPRLVAEVIRLRRLLAE
jgi:hypothetical protein